MGYGLTKQDKTPLKFPDLLRRDFPATAPLLTESWKLATATSGGWLGWSGQESPRSWWPPTGPVCWLLEDKPAEPVAVPRSQSGSTRRCAASGRLPVALGKALLLWLPGVSMERRR